ncbi:LolA family protein [Halodesulfovibrio spirochaetisodalis]|uniref:Outer membrane lipoprotein carrier protein LolA n=1 Tax=Halodesulfovibrio spirochaetisodalis TaxID=1560234 RepID=A0A1B7XBQ6_9BACT|nr:outer membrane lipoprotein carrier protein LolA [Halodesulfovibrio spirochaetisodalis]OBQ50116.1 hypothetical protein SP90_10760 [Halodesulfovibrio spirochaetisodalis]
MTIAPASSFSKELTLFERIKIANEDVHSLKATFTQSSKLALFNDPLVVSGELTLQKPEFLRWEYTKPSVSGFILNDGDGLQWTSTGRNYSVVRTELSTFLRTMASQMLLWVNIDEEALSEDFRVTILSTEPPVIKLESKDKEMAKFIKSIVIELPVSLRGISRIIVTEGNDSIITLTFSNIEINPVLSETTFVKP